MRPFTGRLALIMLWLAGAAGPGVAQDSLVTAEAMPSFPCEGLYLWTAKGPGESGEAMLEKALAGGITVAEAWVSAGSQCMRPIDPAQLLVRVTKGKERCRALGLKAEGALDACYVTWRRVKGP